MDNRKIGVFDSGLGGLTVVREMKRLMPNEGVVYFGDTARVPYGSKSKESIIGFSHQIMHFLMEHDVKAVIIACGTASSNALSAMRASYDLPIIGVVEPGAKAAVRETRSHRIGVLGTSATIRSGAFEKLIHEEDAKATVLSEACPLFVPLVEAGWFRDPVTEQVVERYLSPMKGEVDALVLGCTHYPLLSDTIQQVMGPKTRLINVSQAAVLEMKEFLKAHEMEAEETKSPQEAEPLGLHGYEFYASDSIDSFRDFCESVMGVRHLSVSQVNIEQYPPVAKAPGEEKL